MRSRPDILVLGGGGVLGEAWMSGVLAGIEERQGVDLRRCDYFLGTSAGAIVAARLASGRSPRRPEEPAGDAETLADTEIPVPGAPESPVSGAPAFGRTAIGWAGALSAPWVRLGLTLTTPAGAFARASALRVIPRGAGTHHDLRRALARHEFRFDGRLRVTAVRRADGQRVLFGAPGAPRASVAEAVEASCSVPALYAPVTIDGVEYVDGGVWSPTNLDATPAGRGARVLCLSPTGGLHGPLSRLIRSPSRAITAVELAALRGRGAEIDLVTPDRESAAAIGVDPMARAPATDVLAAGFQQGLRL